MVNANLSVIQGSAHRWTSRSVRWLTALGILILVGGTAYAAPPYFTIDLEDGASVSGSVLQDNGDAFILHSGGRGRPGAIVGRDPYDHYLRLRIDPTLGTCNDKDRSELVVAEDIPMDGAYRYLGFRMMIPLDQPQRHQSANYLIMMQLWQSSPEQPFFTIGMQKPEAGSNLYHWKAAGKSGPGAEPSGDMLPVVAAPFTSSFTEDLIPPFTTLGGDLRPGVWHSFVFRLRITRPRGSLVNGQAVPAGNNANVKLWKDGVVYADGADLPLGYWSPDDGVFTFTMKLGLYKDCEKNDVKFDESKEFSVNLDEVRLGAQYHEVYP